MKNEKIHGLGLALVGKATNTSQALRYTQIRPYIKL